jgi:hypothetical protein
MPLRSVPYGTSDSMCQTHAPGCLLRFGVLLLLVPLCNAATGATAENVVHVTVEALSISPDGTQPEVRHWVLSKLPGPEDVVVSNPEVKSHFVAAIEQFRNDALRNCAVFVTDNKGGNCSFPGGITTLLGDDKFRFVGPADALRPPAAGVPYKPVEIILRAAYMAAPPPPAVESLCIMAAIGPFKGVCSEADSPATSTSLKMLASKYKLGTLPPEWESIQIRTRISPPESQEPAGPVENAADQLEAVAISGFLAARQMNMLPGPKPPTHVDDLENKLLSTYSIDDSGWPAPVVSYDQERPGSGAYQLTITDLHFVRAAFVVLTEGTDIGIQAPATSALLNARLRQSSCSLDQSFHSKLSLLIGTIPTNDGVWKIAHEIGTSQEVAGVVKPTFRSTPDTYPICDPAGSAEPDRIEFTGVHRWVMGTLNGTANAGIKGDPHEIISGDAQISADHLLFPRTASVLNSVSLTAHGGPEVQHSDFAFNIGGALGPQQTIKYGFELDGTYFRDQNQRFGYLAGPKFVDEEYGPAPKAYLEFGRPPESRFSANLRFDLPIEFRHIGIQPPLAFPLFPNRGWVTGFAPTFTALVGYDFTDPKASATPRGGLGQVFVSLGGDSLLSRKSFGGDFDFSRFSVHGQAEMFFGITGTDDFVVRYGRGFSTSSSSTPLFEQPQLGGEANIRAIETGEYIGRSLGFDQTEVGVNAESVWHWVRKRRASPTTAAAQSATTLPAQASGLSSLGISSIFIEALYDRGKVIPVSSGSSLFDLRHAFHGSGIKGELRGLRVQNRRANIGLVYARSTASVLHKKGAFITTISMDF